MQVNRSKSDLLIYMLVLDFLEGYGFTNTDGTLLDEDDYQDIFNCNIKEEDICEIRKCVGQTIEKAFDRNKEENQENTNIWKVKIKK